MKNGWKAFLCLAAAASLSACASLGDFEGTSSFSVNGFTYRGMDLRDPHFYMDDDRQMAPIASDPRCC
jgi:hypothetical protein